MIKIKPTQLYAVQVPDSATDIQDTYANGIMWKMPDGSYDSYYFDYNFNLPYELIGTYQSGNIDFDAGEYVDRHHYYPNYFRSYIEEDNQDDELDNYYKRAFGSFTSLLEANQVPIRDNEKYVILKLK